MRKQLDKNPMLEPTLENLSKAIYIINKHAKTALNAKFLYALKKKALKKLIEKGEAKKVGLHFSRNPKLCQQRSDVVIQCGDYLFHLPPTKEDLQTLPHLGKLNDQTRNPKTNMSLKQAKELLMAFTGLEESDIEKPSKNQSPFYTSYSPYYHQRPVFKRLGNY